MTDKKEIADKKFIFMKKDGVNYVSFDILEVIENQHKKTLKQLEDDLKEGLLQHNYDKEGYVAIGNVEFHLKEAFKKARRGK